jgi:putative flippase GtrA
MEWVQRVPWRSLGRWWIVGLAFFAGGLGILYVFTNMLRMSLTAATSLAAEVAIILRFMINDRWVFGHRRPTWTRLWQFHIASAGGTAIWWVVANALPRFGIHYLIASTAGTACSVFFSMTTNFLWVWAGRGAAKPAIPEPDEGTAELSRDR